NAMLTLISPEITSLGGHLHNEVNYQGFYAEVKTANISDAKAIEFTLIREDDSEVTKTSKPAPSGSVAGVNSGLVGAPFIFIPGTYDEAGSSSWNPAPAVWTKDTKPTEL